MTSYLIFRTMSSFLLFVFNFQSSLYGYHRKFPFVYDYLFPKCGSYWSRFTVNPSNVVIGSERCLFIHSFWYRTSFCLISLPWTVLSNLFDGFFHRFYVYSIDLTFTHDFFFSFGVLPFLTLFLMHVFPSSLLLFDTRQVLFWTVFQNFCVFVTERPFRGFPSPIRVGSQSFCTVA